LSNLLDFIKKVNKKGIDHSLELSSRYLPVKNLLNQRNNGFLKLNFLILSVRCFLLLRQEPMV